MDPTSPLTLLVVASAVAVGFVVFFRCFKSFAWLMKRIP
jgi:hypothetical protein